MSDIASPRDFGPNAVDRSQVALRSSYRIGILPPELCSLAPGDLYLEMVPAVGGVPRIWIGTARLSGFSGNLALLGYSTATPVVITPTTITNPASQNSVHLHATVVPGAMIEMAAIVGTDPNFFTHVAPWSPWDATGGVVDTIWWLPVCDHCRIRFRMRDEPQTYADSNLFAVIP